MNANKAGQENELESGELEAWIEHVNHIKKNLLFI